MFQLSDSRPEADGSVDRVGADQLYRLRPGGRTRFRKPIGAGHDDTA
jgi:hypothetical protein